jgi:tetratricopeptide (TPR) repeat protein
MINQIWRWLKKLWFSLFGYDRRRNTHHSWEGKVNSLKTGVKPRTSSHSNSIKDQDLAFLFNQLLEGVVNGWQENRIEQFFEKLEPKINIETWLEWLQKYRNKLLASPTPNCQLAARMIILGEMTASLPFVRPVGDLAYQIGEELLDSSHDNSLVNSVRSHLPITNGQKDLTNHISLQPSNSNDNTNIQGENSLSLAEILHLLQNDLNFAHSTADKLGLYTTDPGMIMEKLIQQSQTLINSAESSINAQTKTEPPKNKQKTKETATLHNSNWFENWFNLGLEKAQLGDLEGAIASWDKILEVNPNIAQAWHNRGSALAYLDRLEEAIESFDQAITINVNDFQSWNDRGNALYNLKRWQESIISWDRVIGIQPDYYQAWYNRGLALEKLELWQEALASYQQALKIEPNFTQAQNRCQKLIEGKLVKI